MVSARTYLAYDGGEHEVVHEAIVLHLGIHDVRLGLLVQRHEVLQSCLLLHHELGQLCGVGLEGRGTFLTLRLGYVPIE